MVAVHKEALIGECSPALRFFIYYLIMYDLVSFVINTKLELKLEFQALTAEM